MFLSSRVSQATGRGTYPLTNETITKIPCFNVVVNSTLPHVSSVYRNLSPYQSDVLQSVISKGIKNSRYPVNKYSKEEADALF